MVSGRLREHDREKIAKDLIEWAKKDDSINLCKFCAINSIVPSKLSQWAKEDEFFRQAVELAKTHLGARREELLNADALHVKSYDLNATTYDYFLKEERRQQLEFESFLASQNITEYDEKAEATLKALMNQLSALQSNKQIAFKSNSTESKS